MVSATAKAFQRRGMVSIYHECLHGQRTHHTHGECAQQVHTRREHEFTNHDLRYLFAQRLAATRMSVEENLRAARACSLC